MTVSKFLISSLVAAGFGHDGDGVKATLSPLPADRDPSTAPRLFTQDHNFTLAGHSSHSSHASHSSGYSGGHYSHTSHRSSSGGYDYSPPVYVPPAPAPLYRSSAPAPLPTPSPSPSMPAVGDLGRASPPAPDGLPALSGRTKRFEAIVKRVQIALMAQGYYKGAIDGVVSPALRGAVRKFQGDRNLAVTGTITPQTLDAMKIAAE